MEDALLLEADEQRLLDAVADAKDRLRDSDGEIKPYLSDELHWD